MNGSIITTRNYNRGTIESRKKHYEEMRALAEKMPERQL